MIVAAVTFQIHKPDPNSATTGNADLYRRQPVEVIVIYDGTTTGLNTVAANNLNPTLQPGEVFDVLQVINSPFADNPAIFQ